MATTTMVCVLSPCCVNCRDQCGVVSVEHVFVCPSDLLVGSFESQKVVVLRSVEGTVGICLYQHSSVIALLPVVSCTQGTPKGSETVILYPYNAGPVLL